MDEKTFKKILKKAPEVPQECAGCGACCGPCLEYVISTKALEGYLKDRHETAVLRGMGLKNVLGMNWVTTPPCQWLNDGYCTIQETKPDICRSFQQGSDSCRMYLYLNGKK
jgi:Fe-S-cluster containining protein